MILTPSGSEKKILPSFTMTKERATVKTKKFYVSFFKKGILYFGRTSRIYGIITALPWACAPQRSLPWGVWATGNSHLTSLCLWMWGMPWGLLWHTPRDNLGARAENWCHGCTRRCRSVCSQLRIPPCLCLTRRGQPEKRKRSTL